MLHIGFTGARIGITPKQNEALIQLLEEFMERHWPEVMLLHGDCVGADERADYLARRYRFSIWIHPPLDRKYRAYCYRLGDGHSPERYYLDRDHNIVDNSDLLIACPRAKEEEWRSGTWATIRYARKQHKPIYILWP